MKTRFLTLSLTLAALVVLLPAMGFAEAIQGEVASLNIESNAISVKTTDAATGQAHQLDISGLMSADLKGVKSLTELKTGDTVIVNAAKDAESGAWEASTIEVTGETMEAVSGGEAESAAASGEEGGAGGEKA